MKLTADKNGNIRYFSAKLGWGERFDSKEIEMLSAGAVPMLIPPESVQGRKNNIIRYNISPYTTLEFYLSYVLSREQFAQLLLQCIDLFRQMQRVYLSYKNLVLTFDRVYISLTDRSVHFIYLPLAASTLEASIPDFFKRLIRSASRSTYEQISFLDSCLAWLEQPASFSLEAFEDFIHRTGMPETAAAAASSPVPPASGHPQPGPSRAYHPSAPAPAPAPVLPPQAPYPPASVPPSPPPPDYGYQGGTALLDDPGGTVPLAVEATPAPSFCITRVNSGERIAITASPFLVGTEIGSVNYQVTGNTAISRRHASFSVQDGQCYVTDQQSTNKTYVNNCALTPHVPQLLADGDKIRLGNEEFIFSQEG